MAQVMDVKWHHNLEHINEALLATISICKWED